MILDLFVEMDYYGFMIVFHLRRVLAEKDINQKELAEMTGISPLSINRLYHGADRVRFDTLGRICKALGCGVNELLEYVPDEPQAESGGGSGGKSLFGRVRDKVGL